MLRVDFLYNVRGIATVANLCAALWSGLRPAFLMTVPANAIYFTAYEQIRDAVAASSPQSSQDLASMLAAGGAKLLASTATAPLELMRTRMQADRALLAEGMLRQRS